MDQPLKKRRLIDPAPESSRLNEPISTSLPLPPDEVLQKRKNRDELRRVHDCYKRIRFYISQNGSRLKKDFDQAYLYLFSASKGCSSVQRIVAELIPRYASFCPSSLENAAQVVIDMHNCSVGVINGREDFDGVAYQTAKACILGLVDICCSASSEASTSSAFQGICSPVFAKVFNFLISYLEMVEIRSIGRCAIQNIQEPLDLFHELIQKEEENKPGPSRLFWFQALCLLKVLFSCPRDLLGACFELVSSPSTDVEQRKKGVYFINLVTMQLDEITVKQGYDRNNNEDNSLADPVEIGVEDMDRGTLITTRKGNHEHLCPSNNCFLDMVIVGDPSLKDWVLMKWKGLQNLLQPERFEVLSQFLERVFGSSGKVFQELVALQNDVDNADSSKNGLHDDKPADSSVRAHDLTSSDVPDGIVLKRKNNDRRNISSETLRSNLSKHVNKAQRIPYREGENIEGSILSEKEGSSCEKESLVDSSLFRKNLSSTKLRNECAGLEKVIPGSNDRKTTVTRAEVISPGTESGQVVWYSDGDPSAMDVFSASKQLWISSLGSDASESVVRLQFEDFGPVKHFYFFGDRDFAMIEYRNIMDAVRAREFMGGSSPWGASLLVKFLDSGLGCKGTFHGVAIGDSCHVYVGKIQNQQAKEELLQGLVSAGLNGPRTVTDISGESALMLEFFNAEQAALAMEHIRENRRESKSHEEGNVSILSNRDTKVSGNSFYQLLVKHVDSCVSEQELVSAFSMYGEIIRHKFIRHNGVCLLDFRSIEAAQLAKYNLNGARFGSLHVSVEMQSESSDIVVNKSASSPSTSNKENSDNEFIASQLSALFSSICTRFGVNESNNYHLVSMTEEDQVATNALFISFVDIISPSFDDELKGFCNFAAGKAGSLVKLTRLNLQSPCWMVEFNCVDAATEALKNIRSCPSISLHVTFRNPSVALCLEEESTSDRFNPLSREVKLGTRQHVSSLLNSSESKANKAVSPKIKVENMGPKMQKQQSFHSKWGQRSSANRTDTDVAQTQVVDGQEQSWKHDKQNEHHEFASSDGTSWPPPSVRTAGMVVTPPPVPSTSYPHPVFTTSCNSWDAHSVNQPLSLHQNPASLHVSMGVTVPFIPPSVTPLAQIPGNSIHQQLACPASSSASLPLPPPPPDLPPLPPPPPPPLPISQPPFVPPPPSSPPPHQHSSSEASAASLWHGSLCKSGAHYCAVYASGENTDKCKYSNGLFEPANWPSKLDVTQRTAFRHVKTTFSSAQPHKREVCRLLPTAAADVKGLRDFASYLKQRECAGVIKLAATGSMWARVLFILPNSPEVCSLLTISPHPSDSLVALVLPKDTSVDST
ncbi:nucleic acid binding protein [Wolffia australiana]